MSDDLVERLRWSAASTEVSEELTAYGKLLDAAADEIERLRAERVTIPEGYAVVPVEPTEAMVTAGLAWVVG